MTCRYRFADNNLTAKHVSATPVLHSEFRVVSLTVDWINSRLYWISMQRTVVETAGTDGSGHAELAAHKSDDVANWHNIAVDPFTQ